MINRLFFFFIFAILFSACKAPTADYLIKDGGLWNIDELHYYGDYFDTTFTNCGEMSFIEKYDLDGKKDKNYQVEGYMTTISYLKVDISNNFIWVKTIMHFSGGVREGMAVSNSITISNNIAEEIKVKSRTSDEMVWEESNWDKTIIKTYKLSRK